MATETTNEQSPAELRARIEQLEAELARLKHELKAVISREKYQPDTSDPRQVRPL